MNFKNDPESLKNIEQYLRKALKDGDNIKAETYEPKDKKSIRKLYNNIYFKNFPENWTDDDLKR